MDKMPLHRWEKERDAAFLSMDKARIILFMRKQGLRYPNDEKIFWAGVHKAILRIKEATPEQKMRSLKWLLQNGFDVDVY